MTVAFHLLPNPDSLLARLDSRWKLAALLPCILAVALLHTLTAALSAFAASLLLALVGRLPLRWFLLRLAVGAAFLLFFFCFLPVLIHRGGTSWEIGPVTVSADGLRLALLLTLKALGIITLVLVLLTAAPLHATFKAAYALHVPGLFVHLAMLSYRYVFLLSSELSRMRTALRVRGYRNRLSRHSYRTIGHVAGTMLVRGYERAERVGHAMRCRGFDGRFRSLAESRTTLSDVGFFLLLAGCALGIVWWDLTQH
jgi:cobalt/nickel transport system permease protein